MRVDACWRKIFLPLIVAGGLLPCAGCVTPQSYVVSTHDGRVYRSAQAPLLNPKTGYYKFRDRYGRDVLLRDREVSTVVKDSGAQNRKATRAAKSAAKKERQS